MSAPSFLPEDYLALKAERRTNVICLVLFGVVMVAVLGAFLVTNRQRAEVKSAQQIINGQYQEAAVKIEKLTELEKQKEQMLNKAELAAALVERVPRSILLAELINRMPPRLSLIEFDLAAERIKPVVKSTAEEAAGTSKSLKAMGKKLGGEAARAKTKEEAAEEAKRIEPTRYETRLTMVGVAPTDLEVSRYMSELNGYPLLRNVTLEYSQEKDVEGQLMRQFKIVMSMDPDADVRSVDPLIKPRGIRNPMTDVIDLNMRGGGRTVQTPPEHETQDGGH